MERTIKVIKGNMYEYVENKWIRKVLFKKLEDIIKIIGLKPKGYYHLDHINPARKYNLNNLNEAIDCYGSNNLRWLDGSKNISRATKGKIPWNKKS